MTVQGFEDPCYDAPSGTREALTALSIRDTSEEIRVHELEAVPTLIHTQQTKDRFSRGYAVPIEYGGRSTDWGDAQRALPLRTAQRSEEYRVRGLDEGLCWHA